MKKRMFIAAGVVALAVAGFANAATIKSYADFFAPSLYDKSNYTNSTSVGAIVYDTSDDIFYGKDAANNWIPMVNPQQQLTGLVGSIQYANTVSWSSSNNGYQAFSTTTVGSPVVTSGLGTCSQPSTGIPAITCSFPAGTYRVEAVGWFDSQAGEPTGFNFYDGTNSSVGDNGLYPINAGAQLSTMNYIVGYFTYATDQTDRTIEIRAGGFSGAASVRINGSSATTVIRLVKEY